MTSYPHPTERPGPRSPSPREKYMELPKLLGSVGVHQLLEIATSLNDCYSPTDCTIRAQSLVEAAILDAQHDFIDDDDAADFADEHLLWLGAAEESLGKSIRMHRENGHLEGLFDHLLLQLKTEFYALYMPIYKDLACGEITDDSLDETYQALRLFAKQLKKEEQSAVTGYEKNRIRGMQHEAIVPLALMKVLDNAIILPAPLRSDSGESGGWMAHDLNFVAYDPANGRITTTRAWQIKGQPDQLESSKDPYDLSSIDVIFARKNLTGLEWEDLVQSLIASDRRGHVSPLMRRYCRSVMEQSSIATHGVKDGGLSVGENKSSGYSSTLAEQLGRLAHMFNKK